MQEFITTIKKSTLIELIMLAVLCAGASPSSGAAIIADHLAAANFSNIPSGYFSLARSTFNICYIYDGVCHMPDLIQGPHGSQVITGMSMLENENENYAPPSICEIGCIRIPHPIPYPGGWEAETRDYLDKHPETNLVGSLLEWLSGSSAEGVNNYLATMNRLEADYPNVTFIYMTGHLEGSGPSGTLYANNNLIRSFCKENSKILFDFADIESYDPDGNYYPDGGDACEWCSTWCNSHDCPSCDSCAHSHCFNCYLKGKAFWWLLARLSGWKAEIAIEQITDHPSSQASPDIYGDKIVWQDQRNGDYNSDIYMYDLATGEEIQITDDPSNQSRPVIYGDRIVWHDNRDGNWDIYMYDISTKKEIQITTDPGHQTSPDIYGDKIVWRDESGNWDIYMYDISTGEEAQIPITSFFGKPAIYGDRIVCDGCIWVWVNDGIKGYSKRDIYMYDLSTGEESQITDHPSSQASPDIYGDKIVWQDQRNGDYNSDIYMYDLATGEEIQITDDPSNQSQLAIYGDRIVWADYRNGNPDIYMYDISTGEEFQITNDPSSQSEPAIYGDKIVWQDHSKGNWDIYMITLLLNPTYRFWCDWGEHFYTMGEAEKDYIINNLPCYYEGIAWYAYPDQQNNTLPVYRFWCDWGEHFYTMGEAEKDYIINNLSCYYEGIAWYAYPTLSCGCQVDNR